MSTTLLISFQCFTHTNNTGWAVRCSRPDREPDIFSTTFFKTVTSILTRQLHNTNFTSWEYLSYFLSAVITCLIIIKTQVESAIIYGLTAAIKAPVTIANGAVVESNFHDLPVLRINETPKMEVHIVDSLEPPSGIGEIGVPAVAPALANALFAATGQRLRTMPLTLS